MSKLSRLFYGWHRLTIHNRVGVDPLETTKKLKRVGLRPLKNRKSLKTSGPAPTQKPKKLENEWVHTHSKLLKIHKRVGLRPLVPIKLFQSSGEENRARIKKVYFYGQNLQYMQNLQRECSHSFLKKAAFRVGLYPLENRKNVKTSGLVPTRNNKKSLIEWVCTHSNLLKIHKRVDLHPLENRKT